MDNSPIKQLQDQSIPARHSSKVLASISDNDGLNFVLKKTERLASAVYLITGFFDDREPIRWKLRSLASDLLSAGLTLKNSFKSGKDSVVSDIKNLIVEIESQLTVARNAGLISDANYSIIDDEFSNLLSHISPELEANLSRKFFNESAFEASEPYSQRGVSAPASGIARPVAQAEKKESQEAPAHKGQTHDKVLAEGYLPAVRERESRKEKSVGVVSMKKNGRQNIILDMVKKKKEIMIKDVAPLITGCSEKTIQRELLAMVSAGILKKEGEKRWSRYSLASE